MDKESSGGDDDENDTVLLPLPTAAILLLASCAYLILIAIGLLIRKCLISQGFCGDCCPKHFSSDCCTCFRDCAYKCDCRPPTVDSCLDAVCPARQRLNCVELLICDWASFQCCQEGKAYTCGSGACSCTCEAPHCESINCLCCEISFKSTGGS